MKMAVSDQQHQSSVGTLQAALRHQESRGRSLQEELGAVQETLKRRDEEFESYKVGSGSCFCNKGKWSWYSMRTGEACFLPFCCHHGNGEMETVENGLAA